MKKLLIILVMTVLANMVSYSQNIGIVRNAQYRITTNLDPIKKEWEKLLTDQEMPSILTNFEIQSGLDKETGKTFYILFATNKDKSIKMARALKLSNGYLTFYKGQEDPWGVITCSGCQGGCSPGVSGGKWFCDPGCPEGNECKKSITAEMPSK